MRKKNFKGRTEKQSLDKFATICKTYDPLQSFYAVKLSNSANILEARCNYVLDGDCGEYMSDFVCTKTDGELMVRECVYRSLLCKPLTVKLLDMSQTYWLRRGVMDWGIVTDAAEE